MSELERWKTGKKSLLVGGLMVGISLLGKKAMDHANEKKTDDVVVETKKYKVTKKK